jgi:hypothetical protein
MVIFEEESTCVPFLSRRFRRALLALAGDDVFGGVAVGGREGRRRDNDLGLVLLGLFGFAVTALVFLGHRGFLSAGRAGTRDIRVARDPRLFSPACTICLAASAPYFDVETVGVES